MGIFNLESPVASSLLGDASFIGSRNPQAAGPEGPLFLPRSATRVRTHAPGSLLLSALSIGLMPLAGGAVNLEPQQVDRIALQSRLAVHGELGAAAIDADGNTWVTVDAETGSASFELQSNGAIRQARFETAPNPLQGSITPVDVPGVIGRGDGRGFLVQRKVRASRDAVWVESEASSELGDVLPLSGDARSAVSTEELSYLTVTRSSPANATGEQRLSLSLQQANRVVELQPLDGVPLDTALAINEQNQAAWSSITQVPGSRPASYLRTTGRLDSAGQIAWQQQQQPLDSWAPQEMAIDEQGNVLRLESSATDAVARVAIYDRSGVQRHAFEPEDLGGVESVLKGVWSGNKLWLLLGTQSGDARALRTLDGQGRLSSRLPTTTLQAATLTANPLSGVYIGGGSASRSEVITLASYNSNGGRLWQRDLTGWSKVHDLLSNSRGQLRLLATTSNATPAVAQIDASQGNERWRSVLDSANAGYEPIEARRDGNALWIGGARQGLGIAGLYQVWQRLEPGAEGLAAVRTLEFSGRSSDAVTLDQGIVAVSASSNQLTLHAIDRDGHSTERMLGISDSSLRKLHLQSVGNGEVALLAVSAADRPLRYWRLRATDLSQLAALELTPPTGLLTDGQVAQDGSIYALGSSGRVRRWDATGNLIADAALPLPSTISAWTGLHDDPAGGVLARAVGINAAALAIGDPCQFPQSLWAINGDLRVRWSLGLDGELAALNVLPGGAVVGLAGFECSGAVRGGERYSVLRASDGVVVASTSLRGAADALLSSDQAVLWYLRDEPGARVLVRQPLAAAQQAYTLELATQLRTYVLAADARQAWLATEVSARTLSRRAERRLLRVLTADQ